MQLPTPLPLANDDIFAERAGGVPRRVENPSRPGRGETRVDENGARGGREGDEKGDENGTKGDENGM